VGRVGSHGDRIDGLLGGVTTTGPRAVLSAAFVVTGLATDT
jgi:hypothetical protein